MNVRSGSNIDNEREQKIKKTDRITCIVLITLYIIAVIAMALAHFTIEEIYMVSVALIIAGGSFYYRSNAFRTEGDRRDELDEW